MSDFRSRAETQLRTAADTYIWAEHVFAFAKGSNRNFAARCPDGCCADESVVGQHAVPTDTIIH